MRVFLTRLPWEKENSRVCIRVPGVSSPMCCRKTSGVTFSSPGTPCPEQLFLVCATKHMETEPALLPDSTKQHIWRPKTPETCGVDQRPLDVRDLCPSTAAQRPTLETPEQCLPTSSRCPHQQGAPCRCLCAHGGSQACFLRI